MTGVNFNTFVKTALESNAGVITQAQGESGRLVNKGTIGQRIVSALKDFGAAIGMLRPDPTRAQRQQSALDNFKQALVARYGDALGNQALTRAGLDQATRLTGRDVRNALDHATQQKHLNAQALVSGRNSLMPPQSGAQPSDGFRKVVASLNKPDVTPESLGRDAKSDYAQRLLIAVAGASRMGRIVLGHDDLQKIARDTLKQVLKLEGQGVLSEARQARDNYQKAWHNVLVAISRNEPPSELMRHMEAMSRCYDKIVNVEFQGEAPGGSEFQEITQQAMLRALHGLNRQDRSTLAEIQDLALSDKGSLKTLFIAAEKNINEASTETLQSFSHRVIGASVAVVHMVSGFIGTQGLTTDSDEDRLFAGDTLSDRQRQLGVEALGQAHERLLAPHRRMLDDFHNTYSRMPDVDMDENTGHVIPGSEGQGAHPAWATLDALVHFERMVLNHAMEVGSVNREILDMRKVLAENTAMPFGLKARLCAALDAIEARANLHSSLETHKSFKGMAAEDVWRLFATGRHQNGEGTDQQKMWGLEHNGEGSLAAMQNAFLHMINGLDNEKDLTADWLQDIQVNGSKDSHVGMNLRLSYKDAIKIDDMGKPLPPNQESEMEHGLRLSARVPSGFREGPTNLNLRLGSEVTQAGRAELERLFNEEPKWSSWFESAQLTSTGQGFEIVFKPKTEEECKARIDEILGDYNRDIALAESDDDKLRIIARTTQDLYRTHAFMDGNTRTNVFMAMNGMLVKAGLSPAILPEPKSAAGYALDEFIEQIRIGQVAFQDLRQQ